MFFIIKKSEETTFEFLQNLQTSYKNRNSNNCKFIKWFWEWIFKICNKKWYVIGSESKSGYSHDDPIKFLTKSIESSLSDYSDVYILITGNVTVTRTIAAAADSPAGSEPQIKQPLTPATQVAKNCTSLKNYRTEINDTFFDYADFINITMIMCNLINIVTTILILLAVYGILKEMRQLIIQI